MNAKLKKILLIVIVSFIISLACFIGGLCTGYKIAMEKYSSALAEVGELYNTSERTNKELRDNNTELKRINNESTITIDKLRKSLSTAGEQIGNITNGNREAEEILRQLTSIIQSVDFVE